MESPLKYHSGRIGCLTWVRDPDQEQCQVGSLTGAVASQNVTEAPKGSLSLVGNQVSSASAQGSLTVRPTGRAGAKAGTRDRKSTCLNSSHANISYAVFCLKKKKIRKHMK